MDEPDIACLNSGLRALSDCWLNGTKPSLQSEMGTSECGARCTASHLDIVLYYPDAIQKLVSLL